MVPNDTPGPDINLITRYKNHEQLTKDAGIYFATICVVLSEFVTSFATAIFSPELLVQHKHFRDRTSLKLAINTNFSHFFPSFNLMITVEIKKQTPTPKA